MARRVAPTTAEVPMTMGWSKGMAAKVSRPNISMSHQCRGGPGSCGQAAGDDSIEQSHGDLRVGGSSLHPAGSSQLRVGLPIEYPTLRADFTHPRLELFRRHRILLEAHVGEALAT